MDVERSYDKFFSSNMKWNPTKKIKNTLKFYS